ncbi:MAG TPA: hypothetical protein PK447_08205, partial [Ignavibacteria bacterium]|nr:hypothetical protein [Ignavibacteria bacterium]
MRVYKYYIALIPLIVVFLIFTASGRNASPVKNLFPASVQKDTLTNQKILKFNHKLHVKDLEVACD